MKRQITAILTAALLLGSLTACETESTSSFTSEVQSTEAAISLM